MPFLGKKDFREEGMSEVEMVDMEGTNLISIENNIQLERRADEGSGQHKFELQADVAQDRVHSF
jgi:hypothetical protein